MRWCAKEDTLYIQTATDHGPGRYVTRQRGAPRPAQPPGPLRAAAAAPALMPDHFIVCWVASTPSTCIWRHPCIVLAARLLIRQIVHWFYLLRTKLPQLAAGALLHGLREVAGARAARRRGLGTAAADCLADDVQAASAVQRRELPMVLLQRLGAWLPASDMASARLVCRSWRDCLGAQVAIVNLPPSLWQHVARGQLSQLRRLTAAFPLLRTVHCACDRGAPINARCVRRTVGLLARTTPTLCGLRVRGLSDAGGWPALVEGLEPLSPQLTSADFGEVCWPDAASMSALSRSLSQLQRLRLHSPVFSRLTARHVEEIAGMTGLRELSLGFRTVDGTSTVPMALDALTRLSKLVSLELEYTGLLELSSGVGFHDAACLSRLTALTSLSARLIPLPDLRALARLPALRSLHLAQTAPVTRDQASALACCDGLARLELEPLPWELLAPLERLTRLRALGLTLHQPPRGGLPARAADALLSLSSLSELRAFGLAGQLDLRQRHVAALAKAWPRLHVLDLCCGLADGTKGFPALASLRRLRLSPYHWDAWSHDPPLLLHPAELPEGLTSLEARDVRVAAPAVLGARGAGRRGAAASVAGDFGWLGVGLPPSSGSSAGGGSVNGDSASGSGSTGGRRRSGPWHVGCRSAACITGGCCCDNGEDGSSTDGESDASSLLAAAMAMGAAAGPGPSVWGNEAAATDSAARRSSAQWRGEALVLSTPRLRRLVLRCVSTAHCDRDLPPLPLMSRVTGLEELDLQHPQVSAGDLEALTCSPAARTLRSLRLVVADDNWRVRGGALDRLTRLTALESLQLHAHERALGCRVRSAIGAMTALRRLTLVTSPDFPARFAAGLSPLTRLRRLSLLRVGLGFGAVDALLKLRGRVARALPLCRFEMLSDVDLLLEEEEEAAGAEGKDARRLLLGAKAGAAAVEGEAGGAGDLEADGEGAGGGGGAVGAASARSRGPRYARLLRTSWGG